MFQADALQCVLNFEHFDLFRIVPPSSGLNLTILGFRISFDLRLSALRPRNGIFVKIAFDAAVI